MNTQVVAQNAPACVSFALGVAKRASEAATPGVSTPPAMADPPAHG